MSIPALGAIILFVDAITNPETPPKIKSDSLIITSLNSLLIENFFDNFKGNHNEPSFVLNGGAIMKNWVNDILRKMRQGLDLTKRNKADTGMQNQYIKPHEKKDFTNVRPSQKHASTLQKYDSAVTESLKRINELISKL